MKSNILTTLLIILLSFPSHAGWFDSSVSSDEIINQNGLAYLKKLLKYIQVPLKINMKMVKHLLKVNIKRD